MMGSAVINPASFARTATASWQFALLGCTAIALSIASGWTTWEGMRNFTGNPVLSLLIAFGIQGAMLIAAWLIGETRGRNGGDPFAGARSGSASPVASHGRSQEPMHVPSASRTASLWITFLICLTASVFFSFDSLLDTLSSADDRKRASQTRMQSEVAGLLTGVAGAIAEVRQAAIADLFASPGWTNFDRGIGLLTAQGTKAAALLQARQDMAKRIGEGEIALTLEAIAADESRLGSIDTQIALANDKLAESRRAMETAGESVQRREGELARQRTALLAKVAEAEAEAAGAGVTGIAGPGRKFREIDEEEAQLRIAESLARKSLEDALRERLRRLEEHDALLARMADLEARAISHRNEIGSARARVERLRTELQSLQPQMDLEHINALSEARREFLTDPTAEGFRKLQRRCETLAATLRGSGTAIGDGQCETGALSGPAASVFAAGAKQGSYARECDDERRLEGLEPEALLHVGQRCLQMAGLQGAVATGFQSTLRQLSLQQNDRAHRVIGSWNAFFDRNPLAFVALFIAVAVDGLILMSGVYGANARAALDRSAATSVAQRNRAAEMMIAAALQPEPQERASQMLAAVDFSDSDGRRIGHVDLGRIDPAQAASLRAVLNAAIVAGYARPAGEEGGFVIHPGLVELLSSRIEQADDQDDAALAGTMPSELLRLALGRNPRELLQILLQVSRPLSPDQECTHEIHIGWLPVGLRERIVPALNAGLAAATASVDPNTTERYLLRPAFFLTIARIASDAAELWRKEETLAGPLHLLDRSPVSDEPGDPAIRLLGIHGIDDEGGGREPAFPSPPRLTGSPRLERALRASEEDGDEQPASPTLIAFPIEQAEQRSRQGTYGRTTGRPTWSIVDGDEGTLSEELLAILQLATGLPGRELGELADPRTRITDAAACRSLQSLRESNEQLDRRLRELERSVWIKIHELLRCRVRADTGADMDALSTSARKQIARHFPRIFLRWRGLREAQRWCDDVIAQHEMLAETAGIPRADVEALRRIARCLPALREVDEQTPLLWDEIICRINGLCDAPESDAAIQELMP